AACPGVASRPPRRPPGSPRAGCRRPCRAPPRAPAPSPRPGRRPPARSRAPAPGCRRRRPWAPPRRTRGAGPWPGIRESSRGRCFGRAAELAQKPDDRIEELVDHPLLERNDAVVGDVDVLRTDLGAALGDVAEPEPRLAADRVAPVASVEGVHLEARELDEEARPREHRLRVVVTDDVADILAQEALDALVKLLDAIDVLLHHAVAAVGLWRLEPERRDLLRLLVVIGDVGDEVADERERAQRRQRDRLAIGEEVHPGHAQEPRHAVDLGAARATLSRLAVPTHGEVGGLRRL